VGLGVDSLRRGATPGSTTLITELSASFSEVNETNVLWELFEDNCGSGELPRSIGCETAERGGDGDEARLEGLFPDGATI